jgi:hypothetical protein
MADAADYAYLGLSSLEERASLRSNGYATGVWPPKGGPENILEATSTIALSEDYSLP